MAVVYTATEINQRLQVIASAMDAGGGHGVLRLLDAGANVLSSLALALPAASVAAGILTLNGLSLVDPAAAASGTATAARVEDSAGNTVVSGLTVVGAGAGDIFLTPTNVIAAGQTVAIINAQITGH